MLQSFQHDTTEEKEQLKNALQELNQNYYTAVNDKEISAKKCAEAEAELKKSKDESKLREAEM